MQLAERRFSKSFGVRAVAYNNGVGKMGKVQGAPSAGASEFWAEKLKIISSLQ